MNSPAINVTPLIDVLLVLLIIFMVITPAKPSAFQAKIPQEPETNDPRVVPPDQTLVVSVEPDSTLQLNHETGLGSVGNAAALTERLTGIFKERAAIAGIDPDEARIVFIKAPRSLDYGSVARVVDAVKIAGAAPISLQIHRIDD